MTPAPGELEIGRIGSPHGVRGEVTVTFVTNRTERAAPGAELRGGDRTLVIASARPHHGKWLIRFEGVDDRIAAEALRGTLLTAPPLAPRTRSRTTSTGCTSSSVRASSILRAASSGR